MKKQIIFYLCVWPFYVATFVCCTMISPSYHYLAEDADNIEKIVKLDLPDIEDSESSDGSISCWDCYNHSIQFEEPLSADCIAELEQRCKSDTLHWSKTESDGSIAYHYENIDKGDWYEVECTIYKDRASFSCMIDELEGLFRDGLLNLFTGIMVIWGVVLAIVAIVKRIKR